jgi:uncharacterized protein with von Willebrand factor type A (vWA) domain
VLTIFIISLVPVLVKDEKFFDRFDQVFGEHFKGQEMLFDAVLGDSSSRVAAGAKAT